MDSATPPRAPAAASAPYVFAATDERPRGPHEQDLCRSASEFDWLYFGSMVVLDVGSIELDSYVLQLGHGPGVRLLGPGVIGLTWGMTVGGGYLALPKCEPGLVRATPPEGDARTSWPVALAFALFAGATAPIVVGIETGTGPVTLPWSTEERAARLVLAGGVAFGSAFLPYIPLLAPKTWRAAKELEHLRAGADANGAYFSYRVTF